MQSALAQFSEIPALSRIPLQQHTTLCLDPCCYLANTALNIHYSNSGEIEAGGQDATGCIFNHTGSECCCTQARKSVLQKKKKQHSSFGMHVCRRRPALQ